ncbi:MAG TPA: 50S ribosomal protein L11 methyltransferase [Flavipsychrobacter sp.]|nr:50S ribosomal protein L11 methyltransferase [Flavipsychrobacter sp.]
MSYFQVTIPVTDTNIRELLIALLNEINYNGFEETESGLIAYIDVDSFGEDQLKSIIQNHKLTYHIQEIQKQNWNALWEENFQPVVVENFCTVKADFHKIEAATPYEIIITPKMSFGTGHHATTQLMMMQMRHLEINGKGVLDFGTGTGILAILSELLGANKILAIDNDEWSYENAKENIQRNNCKKITIQHSSLEKVADQHFDIILANINRHILLEHITQLYSLLNSNGILLMSGLLKEDEKIITDAAVTSNFIIKNITHLNNWIALLTKKS